MIISYIHSLIKHLFNFLNFNFVVVIFVMIFPIVSSNDSFNVKYLLYYNCIMEVNFTFKIRENFIANGTKKDLL